MYKWLIVFLGTGILFALSYSWAQLEWTGLAIEVSDSWTILWDGGGELIDVTGEWWQILTEVDTWIDWSSWANSYWVDTFLLSGNIGSETIDSIPIEGDISDTKSHLILSEVYYDGTDEWVEITNMGNGNFQGNFILSWAKSTPVSLTNISILSGESKIFGDTLSQISGNPCIGKTGLSLSIGDTTSMRIQILVSGQVEDSFIVDEWRVNKYNDKKTSFEKVGEVSTRTSSGRIANAQSGYIINPGVYFRTGDDSIDVSFPPGQPTPTQSWITLQIPVSCDTLVPEDLLKINEIFPGNEKYPSYIELVVHANVSLNSLSISGDLLTTGLDFSFDTGGTTLEKNSLLLISSSGFRQSEGMQSVRNRDFSLVSTWKFLLITIGSWQNRRVLDIVYLSWMILGKSSYFGNNSYQCARILDSMDDFSPGFERKFLKFMPVTTLTKIEYITVDTGTETSLQVCPLLPTSATIVPEQYTIHIVGLEYDPPGTDTNNEKITLLATNNSGDATPLDMSKTFRVKVNGSNKLLSGYLDMNVPTTFTKTFGFPNSTKSGEDVVVQLVYGDHVFDMYTYNPKKLSPQENKELTSESGYEVTSVIDGDTFRIKYQWKTQSVRLLWIDAPESNKTRYRYLECFGTEAKNYLKSLIDKKKITFQFDEWQDQRDIYDRLLAYVFLDGELINQTMIEEGYAKEYTYKTAYQYQSEFKQAEQSAQEQQWGLWNEKTCGASFSGLQLSGDIKTTETGIDLSWLDFKITYVLPNPKGKDNTEEIGILITSTTGWMIDISSWFTLRIGTKKKKLNGMIELNKENILSGNLGLVNKAACIGLLYQEQELTNFCYPTPKEGQKIYNSNEMLSEIPQENIDILNQLQLKKINNQLCIRYNNQSFTCKNIPAWKAALQTTQEQKLYKWFASMIKQYIITNRRTLYEDTSLKEYFALLAQNKKIIDKGITRVDIYGQSVPITDLKQQIAILHGTPPTIIALFVGEESLH